LSEIKTLPHVGAAFLLSQTGVHSMNQFEARLSAIDLKPQHAGLLRMLGSTSGLTQQALCDMFGVHPSRLVALLDELSARRLIERRQHPSDRRSYQVYITDAGLKILERVGTLTQDLESDLFAALSEAERYQLADMLGRIVVQQRMSWAVHPAYQKRIENLKSRRKAKTPKEPETKRAVKKSAEHK
jgi:DNA-binding MarR family transcriptional regulator